MAIQRKHGGEQPYAAGALKLRIPFVHDQLGGKNNLNKGMKHHR